METKFNEDQYEKTYPYGSENSYWNQGRNKTILNALQRYNIDNILDVGCGRGIVTTYLYENGLKISGVELGSTTPVKKTDCKIFYDTDVVNVPKEIRDKVKALSFYDVIEHIEDPKGFLSNIAGSYTNLEYIVVTVPARKELWSNFDDFYGHFRRYDLSMTKKLFEELNFEVVENRYFFHALYLVIRLNNLINKERGLDTAPPSGFAKTIHKVVGSLFYLERFFIPKSIYGSSVLCIAKKK